jgi:hypothetical protein
MGDYFNNQPNKKHVTLLLNEEVSTQYFLNLDVKNKIK